MSATDTPDPNGRSGAPPVRDVATVDDLLGVFGADGLQRLTDRMLDEAAGRLRRIGAALARGDGWAVREEAHALRSAAGFVGFAALQAAAGALEDAAAQGAGDRLAALGRRLSAAYADARRAAAAGTQGA